MRRANHDLVNVAGEVRAQTDKAIQFFDGDTTVWLPRSQVEANDDGTVTMPEWLAIDKGLAFEITETRPPPRRSGWHRMLRRHGWLLLGAAGFGMLIGSYAALLVREFGL